MNALLTINFNNFLSQNARESFQAAARRWGCLFIEYTGVTDFHSAGCKLKAFALCDELNPQRLPDGVPEVQRLCVIDADCVIRADAPNIFELCSDPKAFYAVRNDQPHYSQFAETNRRMAREELDRIVAVRELPRAVDLDGLSRGFFNSGFWVASREPHAAVLDLAWNYFWGVPLHWWDQMALNLAVFTSLSCYDVLGASWNYQFPQNLQRMSAYVYHFAGDPGRYDKIKQVDWRNV